MQAAHEARQRPDGARLLIVDAHGRSRVMPRVHWTDALQPGDLVVANDAATLPASLRGVHVPSGGPIEVRLAGRPSLAPEDVRRFTAIVFGEGDWHARTEDRAVPPPLSSGDVLRFGGLEARIDEVLAARLVRLRFHGDEASVWEGLARHGRPIQYAHVPEPLALWDVWTAIAAAPVAFEPPSAGFVIDWRALDRLHENGVIFATLTLAAGISSTGDAALDARLPFDEPYLIPRSTARAIDATRRRGGRVIAIGTTVARALEHAGARGLGRVRAGAGVADQRLGPASCLAVVDAILSGTHEPGSSHYELLRAFTLDPVLDAANAILEREGFTTHEFGESVLVVRHVERLPCRHGGPQQHREGRLCQTHPCVPGSGRGRGRVAGIPCARGRAE